MNTYYNKRTATWICTCGYHGIDIIVSAHYRVDVECEMYHAQMQISMEFES